MTTPTDAPSKKGFVLIGFRDVTAEAYTHLVYLQVWVYPNRSYQVMPYFTRRIANGEIYPQYLNACIEDIRTRLNMEDSSIKILDTSDDIERIANVVCAGKNELPTAYSTMITFEHGDNGPIDTLRVRVETIATKQELFQQKVWDKLAQISAQMDHFDEVYLISKKLDEERALIERKHTVEMNTLGSIKAKLGV